MKFKKIMSLALALIMATALCVPALAAGSADSSSVTQGTNLTGSTEVGKISLVVDPVDKVVFNPSKIEVSIGANGGIATTGGTPSNDQVIVPTVKIENKTNVPMKMMATVGIDIKAVAGGTAAQVATGAVADTEKNKKIMLTADFAVNDTNDEDDIQDSQWLTASKLIATAKTATSAGKAHTDAQAVNIPAASTDAANYIFIKFAGSATKAPTDPWTSDDTFDVAAVYKFQPQTNSDKKVLVATGAKGSGDAYTALPTTGTPTLSISYDHDNLTVTPGTGSSLMKDSSGYLTNNQVCPGYTVTIKPAAGSTAGTYYAISAAPTFLDEDGNTVKITATKVGGNATSAYYTFPMPDQHVHVVLTVATEAK